jgi:hypothetical protein
MYHNNNPLLESENACIVKLANVMDRSNTLTSCTYSALDEIYHFTITCYILNHTNAKDKEQYRRLGVDFKPLVMEMHGAISDTFLKFIKKLASAAADRHDPPYCIIFSYWQRRISTVL